MSDAIFSSEQTFVIYSYTVSHGLLLLRSRKAGSDQELTDILFLDVRAMELRASFSDFEIREEPAAFLSRFGSNPSAMMEPGLTAFSISGNGWLGYVLAGRVATQTHDGGFFDTSPLIGTQTAR